MTPRFVPLPAGRGSRFVVSHHPAARPRASIVYVHPFAEEMNKARRMASLQARRLAVAGFKVVLVDLHGCGDSPGEFADAAWDSWVSDVVDVGRWALDDDGSMPLLLWGLRAGCLIVAEAARELDAAGGLLFWQPTTQGKTVLQQFLRLKLAAEMPSSGAKGVVDAMRAELGRGQPVQVAGYTLAPDLAQGLEHVRLDPTPRAMPVAWIEVSGHEAPALLPASESTITRWREAGHRVDPIVVRGASFWNSVEIEEAPALLPATVAAAESLLAC